jgi:tagatose-1,6-bisphosphate aldolase
MSTDIFTQNGKFLMLAFDHRGSFKKSLKTEDPKVLISAKKDIIDASFDHISSLLIDQDYGFPAYSQLNYEKPKPFVMPMEESGYEDVGGERLTTLKYTAKEIKKSGAAGTILLVYFSLESETAQKQIETTKKAVQDSQETGLPMFLEIVTYGKGEGKVAESLQVFLDNGIKPDVYKLEYPGSGEEAKRVTELLQPLDIPWILLTRGAEYEKFKDQLETCVEAGCVGFLAGRGVWQEYLDLLDKPEEKEKFLKETIPQRFEEIKRIVIT